MRKKVFILLLSLISLVSYAQHKSPHDSNTYYLFQPFVGYTTMALGDVKDFYDDVLRLYDENYGLYIPTQKKYPGNILLGATLLYNIPSVMRIGLGGQYSWTEAYSGYEDYAGLFEINSKVKFFIIDAVIERDLETFKYGKIYIGVRGGKSFVDSDYANSISLNDYPAEAGAVKLKGDGDGFSFQPYLGVQRFFGNLQVGLVAGYRMSKIKEIDGELTIPGEGSFSGELELEHDLSGVVINATLGYRFNR